MPSIENRPTDEVLKETREHLARVPDITVSALRARLRVSTDRARGAHQAVRWERGYSATRGLSREQLDREFRNLVRSVEGAEPMLDLDVPVADAGRDVDASIGQLQRAYVSAVNRVRTAALEQVSTLRERAAADVAAAHEDTAMMAVEVDLYMRQAFEAQAETGRLRAESDARIRDLERDILEAGRMMHRAEASVSVARGERDDAVEKLENERGAMRLRDVECHEQLLQHKERLARSEAEASTLRTQISDLQDLLTRSSDARAELQAQLLSASQRAAAAEARLEDRRQAPRSFDSVANPRQRRSGKIRSSGE